MKIKALKFVRATDRETGAALLVNGKVAALVNCDSHGIHGEDALETVIQGLAKLSGVTPEYAEVDDDDFHRITAG